MSNDKIQTDEFRQMAVKMALQADNIADVARELGIPYYRLNNWLVTHRKAEKRSATHEENHVLKAKLAAAEKRNAELEQEVDILKKAAAYFAKRL